MLTTAQLFEISETVSHPGKFKTVPELVRWAKKQSIMDKDIRKPKDLKPGEYAVPKKVDSKQKVKRLNIKTGRMKKMKPVNNYIITKIPPEERTLKNLPRYANKKSKVRFQDWLMLTKSGAKTNHSVGRSPNGNWYGWSHRAIGEFKPGKIIKPGTIGNKYDCDVPLSGGKKFKPYAVKDDTDAQEHAIRFAKDVS